LSFELDGLSSTEGAFGVAHVLAESHDVSAWPGLAIAMGTQSVGASRVVRHPNLDAALVRLASPLVMNGSSTGYQFQGFYASAPSTLVGKTLDCYGWGWNTTTGGYGTLRTADLKVGSASSDSYVLDANDRNQI